MEFLKDKKNTKSVTCIVCGKTTTGGITRAKQHQLGTVGNVGKCTKTSENVKEQLRAAAVKKAADKMVYMNEVEVEDEEEDVQEIRTLKRGKRPVATASSEASTPPIRQTQNVKGPMDLWMMMKDLAASTKLTKTTKQTSIKEHCAKEARAIVVEYIERFLVRNGIAFNVVRTKSFKQMLQAVRQYGPNLKPPSYHECRVPLLKKELEYTKRLMKNHEVWRDNHGCPIMSDGWTDRKGRTLINFLVNTPTGTMFVKSVDASSYMKTREKVHELLDSFVEEIGESKVVQVIIDNGSNYKLAGKLLMVKRPHLFWTPCAAHCLDLILEDIGKLTRIKRTINKGVKLVGYIYNHSLALNLLRTFTNGTELVRHGITRFATTFLTLQRLYKLKTNLRKMFTSDEWLQSKGAKEVKAKRAMDIVLLPSFWEDVYSLKAMGPIVLVLRLVDEKKPAMSYIYEAMERAKESIQNAFKGNETKYKEIFEIIDRRRWDCQLYHPLHAAGYYLNPQFYFSNASIERDGEVKRGLLTVIERLSKTTQDEDMATVGWEVIE